MNKPEDRLHQIRARLAEGLVERGLAVRLALLAALSGEHLLLVGPPGTAKSLVARRLRYAFADTSYFERLLTRFSVPEELFGPLSIKGLEEDRYERITDRYLPTASIAFLDEIFKANSAILNALLTLLNEREFDNGAQRVATPLTALIGASNELPEGEELDALFDRFLLRLHVEPVSSDGFSELIRLSEVPAPDVPEQQRLTREDLADFRNRAKGVEVPDEVLALLEDLRKWCADEKIRVSDRRWWKTVKLLKTSALTNGQDRVSIWDCWLLQYCLWRDRQQKEKIYEWYASRVGAAADTPAQVIRFLNVWEKRLRHDREQRVQLVDTKGSRLYKDRDGKDTTSELEQKVNDKGLPLFKVSRKLIRRDNGDRDGEYTADELDQLYVKYSSARRFEKFKNWSGRKEYLDDQDNWIVDRLKPALGPLKHHTSHVEHCLAEIGRLQEDVERHRQGVAGQIASFQAAIHDHMWVSDDFVEPASKGLAASRDQAELLLARVAELSRGYESLPRKEEEPELEPEAALE